MRKIIVGLLALTLGFGAASCNNQQQEHPSKTQPTPEEKIDDRVWHSKTMHPSNVNYAIEDNPLLKELEEIIKKDKSGGFGFEEGRKFITSKVEEVYKRMNTALAQKDLPGFVRAYQEAVLFGKQIMVIGGCYGGSFHWMELFDDMNQNYFGNIYTKVMANPKILDDWPAYCGTIDQRARSLANELYNFDRNKRLSEGDKIGDKSGNGHQIWHEDRALTVSTSRNIHPNATTIGEGRYFLDGTYTEMWFSEQADVMVYNLITNTRSESPLESTAHRECSFIDLGMDGIDACDARLNGVKESDITLANERAIGCMAKTTEVLKRRYAGTGFIK